MQTDSLLHAALRWLSISALAASTFCASFASAQTKLSYARYSNAIMAAKPSSVSCISPMQPMTAGLLVVHRFGVNAQLLGIEETASRTVFRFEARAFDEILIGPGRPPVPVIEAYRTYVTVPGDEYEVVAFQSSVVGERFADAVRVRATSNGRCANVYKVVVTSGDMQVTSAGQPFALPSINVTVTDISNRPTRDASVSLSPTGPILFSAQDTGVIGPQTALLTDVSGKTSLALSTGSRSGVARFFVNARGDGEAIVMVTLMQAPANAIVRDSVPVIEYAYGPGARFLTVSPAVVRQADSDVNLPLFRTGQVWRAFTTPDAVPGLAPVCQFFGRPSSSGEVTHFFTANVEECAALRAYWGSLPPGQPKLDYEGIAFYAVVFDATGRCPAAFPIPVVRYFNNVSTPSSPTHRYNVEDPATVFFPPAGSKEGIAFCTDVGVSS